MINIYHLIYSGCALVRQNGTSGSVECLIFTFNFYELYMVRENIKVQSVGDVTHHTECRC